MSDLVMLVLVGLLIVDIVWTRLHRDRNLDAEMRHRDLMRELRRHDR